jgi:tetratricopeptide (TPR) repeat protein
LKVVSQSHSATIHFAAIRYWCGFRIRKKIRPWLAKARLNILLKYQTTGTPMDDETRTLHGHGRGIGPELRTWGPFDLIDRVGRGGFGEVYRGFDPALRREVAVKLLLPGTGDMPALLREARAMAQVTHSNLVPIYGVDTHDGRAGFWSAFIHGKTLSELLRTNGPFGPREAILIGIDVCRALSAVHASGLVHGDIKSGNVMREEGGRILLMDFGLTDSQSSVTLRGGTPKYMSPEMLRDGRATVRTDVYAIGMLLYHILTAQFPEGEHWSLLEKRPDLSPALVSVVHRSIEQDPEKRFATAAEMAVALADAGDISASLAPIPDSAWKGRRVWTAIAVAVFLVAAAGRYVWDLRGLQASAPPALQQRYDSAHELLQHSGRKALEKAISELGAITGQSPQFAVAFADLGRANYWKFLQYRDLKYVEPARAACLKALSINPNLASAHVTLGMLYTQTDQYDLATQELDQALSIDRLNAEEWAARAELYLRQGRTDDVEPTLRKAIDLAPKSGGYQDRLAFFYFRLGKFDEAIEASREAVRLSPDNAGFYNNLGNYLSAARRLPEAETALRKALALEPGYNRYANLSNVLQQLGRLPEAEKMAQAAIDLNPDDYRAWCTLASQYWLSGDIRKARETYRKSIARAESLRSAKPREVYLLADLGMMYAALGDADNALPLLRQVTALGPENADALFQSAVGYELLHERNRAIETLTSALRQGYPKAAVDLSQDLAEVRKDPRYIAMLKSLP